MESALIISTSEKGAAFFVDMLNQCSVRDIVITTNAGQARRLMLDRDFDLCIINTPISDEFGDKVAKSIASEGSTQVILVVKTELAEEISTKVEDYGIFTLEKPISKNIFWSMLKLAKAAYNRTCLLQNENRKLLQKIEDIRLVDRAKCVLIQKLGITEEEAHRQIEKDAMDSRTSRRIIAERLLQKYES